MAEQYQKKFSFQSCLPVMLLDAFGMHGQVVALMVGFYQHKLLLIEGVREFCAELLTTELTRHFNKDSNSSGAGG